MIRHWRRGSRRNCDNGWCFRHHDPGNDVRQYPAATEEGDDQPYDAYDGHVEVEILGKSRAYAGDLPVRAAFGRTHQPRRWTRNVSNPSSAVSAQYRIVLNLLTAIVAEHEASHMEIRTA